MEAVVVSYNTRALLDACLSSLHETAPGLGVTVVDNASPDGSAAFVRERHPGVRVVANDANEGFAAAVNRGFARTTSEYVLLLNADTEVRAGAPQSLRAALEADAKLAVVGPRLVHPDGRAQESRARFPTPRGEWRAHFGRGPDDFAAETVAVPPGSGEPRPPWYLMGAALLVRRAAWEDVGPFDEAYFFYLEEVDWFARAWTRGWGWRYVESAIVVHHLGASLRGADPVAEAKVKRNWHRSRMRFLKRHHGAAAALRYRWATVPVLAAKAFGHTLRVAASRDREARARGAIARAVLADTILGRDDRC